MKGLIPVPLPCQKFARRVEPGRRHQTVKDVSLIKHVRPESATNIRGNQRGIIKVKLNQS